MRKRWRWACAFNGEVRVRPAGDAGRVTSVMLLTRATCSQSRAARFYAVTRPTGEMVAANEDGMTATWTIRLTELLPVSGYWLSIGVKIAAPGEGKDPACTITRGPYASRMRAARDSAAASPSMIANTDGPHEL